MIMKSLCIFINLTQSILLHLYHRRIHTLGVEGTAAAAVSTYTCPMKPGVTPAPLVGSADA